MVSMDEIKTSANKVMQLYGKHPPLLALVIENNLIEIPIQFLEGDTPEKVSRMFSAGKFVRKQIREQGIPDHLPVSSINMIVEAWMVSREKTARRINKRPSEHPDRIEILMITRYEPQRDLHTMAAYEIVRKPDGNFDHLADRRENHDGKINIHNPMLAAFYAGLEESDGLYKQVLDSMEAASKAIKQTGDLPNTPPSTPLH